ncbi:MAG: Hsp20/alpha crystallin family protein [Opitutaceae bacterium]|nr:Hsp20/alpha crystallin family protein [Opitutaceae bacterium]
MNLIRYSYPQYRHTSPVLTRSPWGGLEAEIDRLFGWTPAEVGTADAPARLAVELHEDNAHAYVRAELPGVSRNDINVEVVDGELVITATRKLPALGAADGGAEAKPVPTFTCRRAIALSDEIDAEKVSATHEDGLLTVTLAKRAPVQPKKIAVAVK